MFTGLETDQLYFEEFSSLTSSNLIAIIAIEFKLTKSLKRQKKVFGVAQHDVVQIPTPLDTFMSHESCDT